MIPYNKALFLLGGGMASRVGTFRFPSLKPVSYEKKTRGVSGQDLSELPTMLQVPRSQDGSAICFVLVFDSFWSDALGKTWTGTLDIVLWHYITLEF